MSRSPADPTGTVGIIGAGRIGQALARTALTAGRKVVIANSRGPESLAPLVAALGTGVSAGTVREGAVPASWHSPCRGPRSGRRSPITPQAARPRQLNCGIALFTLLDGGLPPSGTGLVSLAAPYRSPTAFVGGPNLFGQGAEVQVERFHVEIADVG